MQYMVRLRERTRAAIVYEDNGVLPFTNLVVLEPRLLNVYLWWAAIDDDHVPS
jgi:hypothetical protein